MSEAYGALAFEPLLQINVATSCLGYVWGMNRDPAHLRAEAAACRELAYTMVGENMMEALEAAASALDSLAAEIDGYRATLLLKAL